MSRRSHAAIALMTLAGVLSVASPLRAQDEADSARFRARSLSVSPAIITSVGRDDNIFNDSAANDPKSDVMAIAVPVLQAWLRTPRVRFASRNELDMYYFRDLTFLRAIDNDHTARIDVTLNRLMPWAAGNFSATRHRQNLEIDAIAKRRNDNVTAGADLRLTGKMSAGVYAGRSEVRYDSNSVFRGTDLALSLNHTGSNEGLRIRFAATPLTTFSLDAEKGRDKFEFSPERDSDSFRVGPSVDFKPLALVSGHAGFGFGRVTFKQPGQPEFKSTVGSVDLQYNFRATTQIAVTAQRNLEYSYLYAQRDYVLTALTPSVTQRFGESWEVRGNVGRNRLSYRRRDPGVSELPAETILSYGISAGYHIGRNRVGFDVQHNRRRSDVDDGRGYDRLRVTSSLTYGF